MSADDHIARLQAFSDNADKSVMSAPLSVLNGTLSKDALEILVETGRSGPFTLEDIATLASVRAEQIYSIFRLTEDTPPEPMDPAVASVMAFVYGAMVEDFDL